MSANISFRTEESKRELLDRIAELQDRDRSWVINEAIDNYLDLQSWQIEEIKRGMADTKAGRTISTEELERRLAKRHQAAKAKAKLK